jgi:membrane-bound lytic murein transglycosylase D
VDSNDSRGPRHRRALALSAVALLLALPLVGGAGAGTEDGRRASDLLTSADAHLPRLPLDVNERVTYWMERFQTDQRSSFEYFLAREGIYGDLIRAKLRERGMPDELLYLAMIESGFSARATSEVAAVGLWQFMGPTARQYGLRVDQWVDERRDPVRATDAALDYLEWLHERYDSWYLAAAAYNAGPGRVDRSLRGAPVDEAGATAAAEVPGYEDLYWEIQHDLPPETREHVPRMVAATLLARDARRNGFDVTPASPYEYDRVFVPGGTSLALVARAVDADVRLLRGLNPHLVLGVTPPGASYALRVPVGTTQSVVAAIGGGPWGSNARADDD